MTLPVIRTRAAIEDALVTWMALATGAKVVIGWPNAPRALPLPYMKMRFFGWKSYGQDDLGNIDSSGVQLIYGDRIVTLSINAYGTGALDLIRKLCNSIWQGTIIDTLLAQGISPMLPGPIHELTEFLETEAEERAHVDFDVGVKDVYTDDVGLIEHVTGDGKCVAETGTEITLSFAADLA